MGKFKTIISIIIVVFCMLFLYKYVFIKTYYEVNEELPDNMTSGKSLVEYARIIVEENSGKEFNVGEVYMILDSKLKGEVKVTLVEKKEKKPLLVFVNFDTKSNKLLSFDYESWDSKLHPGLIDFQDWEIDYTDAIEISEEVFSQTDGFRYDCVHIHTVDSFPSEDEDWEDWFVALFDDQNKKRYYTRIDPYTGEITRHSISEY